jgi:hypothetical protein
VAIAGWDLAENVSAMRAQLRWPSTPLWRIVFAGIAIAFSPASAPAAATSEGPAIEELLKTGWQIAGYSQAFDNRSTFILFRHPEQTYLVQCRVGYDGTRLRDLL